MSFLTHVTKEDVLKRFGSAAAAADAANRYGYPIAASSVNRWSDLPEEWALVFTMIIYKEAQLDLEKTIGVADFIGG